MPHSTAADQYAIMCAMTDAADLSSKLASLPRLITRKDIAWLVGVAPETVRGWSRTGIVKLPKHVDRDGNTLLYLTAEVAPELPAYLAAVRHRSGPRPAGRHPDVDGIDVVPGQRVTDDEIAELRGVTPGAIRWYERRYTAKDPFPARDRDGRRALAEVAQWFQRHSHPSPHPHLATAAVDPALPPQQRRAHLLERFSALPELCTKPEIMAATGAGKRTVDRWVRKADFPASTGTGRPAVPTGRPQNEYPTAEVCTWCIAYLVR